MLIFLCHRSCFVYFCVLCISAMEANIIAANVNMEVNCLCSRRMFIGKVPIRICITDWNFPFKIIFVDPFTDYCSFDSCHPKPRRAARHTRTRICSTCRLLPHFPTISILKTKFSMSRSESVIYASQSAIADLSFRRWHNSHYTKNVNC